jgi:glycosyltransferase involved in cell wall biosynthesis
MDISSTRKRVLIFSLSYYPRFIGGAEVAIKEITDRLTDIEFHMVTLRYDSMLPKVEQIGNVLVHRIGFSTPNPSIEDLRKFPLRLNKFLFQFLAVAKAQKLHRTHTYDGVWAMMAHACGIPAGIFKTRNPNVPYLLTLQEGDPPETIERSMKKVWPLFRRAFTRANALQAISSFLASWGTRMGFRGAPDVIPNGVDLERFANVGRETRTGKTVSLITTSRLVPKNAVDDVIRALALLPVNISFTVCGIGPEETNLKKLAHDVGVEGRVRFLGEVSHTELPALLKEADIFIRPSRSEGMGNSFIEAMAVGLPVIATQEGGIGDFLFDAKRNPGTPATGYAVDKNSPEQIADVVKEIIAHPEAVAKTTARAKELVILAYGWDRVAGSMREVFNRLIG